MSRFLFHSFCEFDIKRMRDFFLLSLSVLIVVNRAEGSFKPSAENDFHYGFSLSAFFFERKMNCFNVLLIFFCTRKTLGRSFHTFSVGKNWEKCKKNIYLISCKLISAFRCILKQLSKREGRKGRKNLKVTSKVLKIRKLPMKSLKKSM